MRVELVEVHAQRVRHLLQLTLGHRRAAGARELLPRGVERPSPRLDSSATRRCTPCDQSRTGRFSSMSSGHSAGSPRPAKPSRSTRTGPNTVIKLRDIADAMAAPLAVAAHDLGARRCSLGTQPQVILVEPAQHLAALALQTLLQLAVIGVQLLGAL